MTAPTSPNSTQPTTLVWFDRDLRIADHAPLAAAADRGRVVPVFVWAPDEEAPWEPGGAWRWFLHHALAALDGSLRALGAPLVILRGPTGPALAELAARTGADAVYTHRRFDPPGRAREAAVAAHLNTCGLTHRAFSGRLLHDPDAIRTKAGDPFRVFTPFWRALGESLRVPDSVPAPRALESAAVEGHGGALASLDLLPTIPWDAEFGDAWTPSEAGAAEALDAFVAARVDGYPDTRDIPGTAGTSRLSPHLAHGTVSPRTIWHTVAAISDAPFSRGEGAAEYLREVCWREFAWHVLYHFPETTERPMKAKFAGFPWRSDPALFRRWTRGETGYPLVDAGMKELWRTGWMHNRVRMVAASFLTKHLLIDWRDGARWFWDTLVDADLANNTMGWQWVAGSGADAAPYFRIFNPSSQADRFDGDGAYRRRWLPQEGLLHPETPPIVDHADARARALDAYASL